MGVMCKLMFSVLMSVYYNDNSEDFEDALLSVINQTIIPDEIILVIDGPIPEATMEKISLLKKEYPIIRVFPLEKNLGLGPALNYGLKQCTYELVARMDSDDISVPNRFEKQLKCFEENPNLSVVGGFIDEFEKNPEHPINTKSLPTDDENIKKFLKYRNPINHQTVMFKRIDVEKVGGYKDWHFNEDYFLWIRMSENDFLFKNIDSILVHMRVNDKLFERRGGYKYFQNQKKLMYYMLEHNIITYFVYIQNILKRFLVQVLFPNRARRWIYKTFLRKR